VCSRKGCYSKKVYNAVDTCSGKFGDVCKPTCTSGFRSSGNLRCQANKEFAGDALCGDINECTEKSDNCDRSHGICINSAGKFSCGCKAGYALAAGTKCSAKPCADKVITYAASACRGRTTDVCKANCAAGYRGSGSMSCGTDGVFTGDATCTACNIGSYGTSAACTLCAAGRYQPSAGQASCLACPAGARISEVGATALAQCKTHVSCVSTFKSCAKAGGDDGGGKDSQTISGSTSSSCACPAGSVKTKGRYCRDAGSCSWWCDDMADYWHCALPPPCPAGFTCVKTGAALVAKLKAAESGDKLSLVCTKAKRCVISGVLLTVGKNVEVKMEYVDVMDHDSGVRRCCPVLRARLSAFLRLTC